MALRKVIGLGLNRTGTGTLRAALEVLGYPHYRFQPAMMQAWARGDMAALIAESHRHDVLADLPWPMAFRELYQAHGDVALYVLTTRADADAWIASQKAHTERTGPETRANLWTYGHAYPHGVEAQYRRVYDRHNADVRGFFAGKHCFLDLCWERGDGWEAICGALGRPEPTKPFPHQNASADSRRDPDRVAANRAAIRRQINGLT